MQCTLYIKWYKVPEGFWYVLKLRNYPSNFRNISKVMLTFWLEPVTLNTKCTCYHHLTDRHQMSLLCFQNLYIMWVIISYRIAHGPILVYIYICLNLLRFMQCEIFSFDGEKRVSNMGHWGLLLVGFSISHLHYIFVCIFFSLKP